MTTMATVRIRDRDLREAARTGQLAPYLGPLEPWLVGESATPPRIPSDPGSAVILCAKMEAPLERGCAIPVQWKARDDAPDCEGLPRAFREVADSVRRALGIEGWSLRLHPSLRGWSLEDLEISADSAALPLALALHLACRHPRSTPASSVLATGALREEKEGVFVASVGGYDQKAAIAARLLTPDGEGRRWLVVPQADENAAREACRPHGIEVLPIGGFLPQCLGPALVRLDAEPPDGASLEQLCEYANRKHVRQDAPAMSRLYERRLAAMIGAKIRAELPESLQRIDRLLLPVSTRPDTALLSIETLRPEQVRLVVSEDADKAADVVEQRARAIRARCERLRVEVRPPNQIGSHHVAEARRWLEEGGRAVVDVTPGNREILMLCMQAATAAGATIVYVKTADRDGRPVVGTERLLEFPGLELRARPAAHAHGGSAR